MIKGLLLAIVLTAGFVSAALAADEPISTVVGLADGEMANVRSDDDPDSKIRGQLANGAPIHVLRCHDEEGVEWCRVRASDQSAQGFDLAWLEGRYIASMQPVADQADIGGPSDPAKPPTVTSDAAINQGAEVAAVDPVVAADPGPELVEATGEVQVVPSPDEKAAQEALVWILGGLVVAGVILLIACRWLGTTVMEAKGYRVFFTGLPLLYGVAAGLAFYGGQEGIQSAMIAAGIVALIPLIWNVARIGPGYGVLASLFQLLLTPFYLIVFFVAFNGMLKAMGRQKKLQT